MEDTKTAAGMKPLGVKPVMKPEHEIEEVLPPVHPAEDPAPSLTAEQIEALNPVTSPLSVLSMPRPHEVDPNSPERRVNTQAKTVTTPREHSLAEAARRAKPGAAPAQTQYMFMSRFPQLVVYVEMGKFVEEKGRAIRAPVQVKFANGIFVTSHEDLAQALRSHKRCGRLFNEERSRELVAVREAAARARANMTSPAFVGATASTDGSDPAFLRQAAELETLENRVFTL